MNIDVNETMEKEELKTARGRRKAVGREINTSKSPTMIKEHAEDRRCAYLRAIEMLHRCIGENSYGIDEDELDAVEFVNEQLERLVRYANEKILEHIGKDDGRCL